MYGSEINDVIVVNNFIPKNDCETLVRYFDTHGTIQETRESKIVTWGDPDINLDDIKDPQEAIAYFHQIPVTRQALVHHYFPKEVRNKITSITDIASIQEDIIYQFLNCLNQMKNSSTLYTDISNSMTYGKDSEFIAYERYLLKCQVLVEKSDKVYVNNDLNEAQTFDLHWFNIFLMETYVFSDLLFKYNLLVVRPYELDHLITKLHQNFPKNSLMSLADFIRKNAGSDYDEWVEEGTHFSINKMFSKFVNDRSLIKKCADYYSSVIEVENDKKTQIDVFDFFRTQFKGLIFREQIINGYDNVEDIDYTNSPFEIQQIIKGCIYKLMSYVTKEFFNPLLHGNKLWRCKEGSRFFPHVDNEEIQHLDGEKKWVKIREYDYTAVFYFSDPSDYEGGEIAFLKQKKEFKPEQGAVVIFPSDHRFPHEVKSVYQGQRYSFTNFFLKYPV